VGELGNRKNELVNKIIEDRGVKICEGSVELIQQLRRREFKTATVTSNQNCEVILKAASLHAFFDLQVDCSRVDAQHLSGKPAPDTVFMGARLLAVQPKRESSLRMRSLEWEVRPCSCRVRKGNAEEL
jgi:beta-phosphoglucomutase-like phosphatase (HAD superfamily)